MNVIVFDVSVEVEKNEKQKGAKKWPDPVKPKP